MRVALVTCAEVADLDPDDRLVVAPLAAQEVCAEPVVWDADDVDWSSYDLAVLRSTWDYPGRREQFLAWAHRVPTLANQADVVAWNTDKRYLAELAAAGLPVVSTTWLAAGKSWTAPRSGAYVIKPSVGVGSLDTERYDLGDAKERRRSVAHIERLHRAARDVMIQPYLSSVDHQGETALLFIGGVYSHAVRKGPMLIHGDQGVHSLYRPEEIAPREANAAERAVAERVLAAVPGGPDRLLYARVDLVPGPDDAPVLLELELTEPSLYLGFAADAAERSPKRSSPGSAPLCVDHGEVAACWSSHSAMINGEEASAGDDRYPPSGCDEQAGEQLDQDREADGFERVHGRRPRLAVGTQPDALGQVDAEDEADEQPDHGYHEEPDRAQNRAEDDAAPRDSGVAHPLTRH
jgi:hypothetical protein